LAKYMTYERVLTRHLNSRLGSKRSIPWER
jgi:hypothetical protein